MTTVLGQDVGRATIGLLFLTGVFSTIVPNIPLVVGMIPVVKAYSVAIGLAPATFLSDHNQPLIGLALALFIAS